MPYSTRFFAGSYDAGASLVYTVPALYVAVLRDLEVLNLYDGANVAGLYLDIPGPLQVQVGNWPLGSFGEPFQWQGRVVLNAGDEIQAVVGISSIQMVCSGYLLSAP